MQGRRVASHEVLEAPGDYALEYSDPDGSEIESLWACLPRTGTVGRIPAVGHGQGKPEWTIVENASETVTVLPSIDEGDGGYHGHLTDGIWSDG